MNGDTGDNFAGLPDAIRLALLVTNRFTALGIRHLIGGSVASIVHGIPRLTQDVALVADIKEVQIPALVAAFEDEFYIDEQSVRRAVRRRASLNLIYLEKMFKIDVFLKAVGRHPRRTQSAR